jgi:hypothetical protein
MHINLTRGVLAVAAFVSLDAVAVDSFKCELPGGRIEYQSQPCAQGRETRIKQPAPSVQQPSATSDSGAKVRASVPSSEFLISVQLDDLPLKTELQAIALSVGYRLVLDPSITESGSFHYRAVPWKVVLADIAARYRLNVLIQANEIVVTRR